MKNPFLLSLLFLMASMPLWSQTDSDLGNISNVDWSYDAETEAITITYDLARVGAEKYFHISIGAILDGQPLTPSREALTGDIGEYIRAGLGKKIVWDATQDIVFTENASLKFKVTASKIVSPTDGPSTNYIPTEPNIFVPIGAGVLGGGLVAAGIAAQHSDPIKIYENTCDEGNVSVSESNLTPNASGKSPCDELYDDAQKKYKTGGLLLTSGIGILVSGGSFYIKQMLDYNNGIQLIQSQDEDVSLRMEPTYRINRFNFSGASFGSLGLQFTLSF